MFNKYVYGVFVLRDEGLQELCCKPTPKEANKELDNYRSFGWSGITKDDTLLVIRYGKEQ